MKSFSFSTTKKLIFGIDAVNQVSDLLKKLNISNVLIVTGNYSVRSGLVNRVIDPIQTAGIDYKVYSNIEPNPTIENSEKCFRLLKECEAEAVIGFGGGSAADVAKAAALLCKNPLPIQKYFGVELVPNPTIPVIIVPTTAGTGTEVSSGAVLKDESANTKSGIISHYLIPDAAIVDPKLTLTSPSRLTASSGMDAFTHAIEGYLSVKANPISEIYHKEAIKLIAKNLRTAVFHGNNIEARYNMSLGATLAGIGMVDAGCGAVHAMAYPIEGKYKIAHGDANAALLASFIRKMALRDVKKIKNIAGFLGENQIDSSSQDPAITVAKFVSTLCLDVDVPKLRDIGVLESDLDQFAESAISNSRLMSNSPISLTMEQIKMIYYESC